MQPRTEATMKRFVQFLLTAAAIMLAATASAQPVPPRATAYATAPDIPYESVPNFLKLPPDLYLGEGIGIARTRRATSSSTRAAATRGCSSSIRTAPSSARSARASTASSSRTPSASTRRTTSGSWTRGRTWSSSSTPRAASLMVLGRRPEAGRRRLRPHGDRRRRRRAVSVRPADRRRVGSAGQHLRLRRLRQLARREVRQERPVHQVGRRRAAPSRTS